MIRVEELSYRYPPILPGETEWRVVLDSLSFDVPTGACLGVTGPNACGKSTLCLAVAGLAPRLTEGRLSGSIEVAGCDPQREKPGALADTIGLLLQGPTGQLFNPTVGQEIAWGLENLGLPPPEIEERIEWALARVGLDNLSWDQPPDELSGGQQKRLALASILALRPQAAILDEPSGGLSPLARRELIALLDDLRREMNLTLLLADGDPDLIAALADETLVLEEGHSAHRLPPRQAYLSVEMPGLRRPAPAAFARRANVYANLDLTSITVEEAAEQLQPVLLRMRAATVPDAGSRAHSDSLLQVERVSFSYYPDQPILHAVSFDLHRGETIALLGDNGAGKTTLARHLIGLLRPDAGRVAVMGQDTAGLSIGQIAQHVGLAFQNPEQQIFNPTVREELAFGPRSLGLKGAQLEKAVADALDLFGLGELEKYPPAALTFSARRMVALASIAAMRTPILALDESLMGLDAAHQESVVQWLESRRDAGAGILLITHDMELVARLADRVIILQEGRIAADGPLVRAFLRSDLLEQAGLEAPFAFQLADQLQRPDLAGGRTPQGVAEIVIEGLA